MHILICNHSSIPVFAYGGTERVIWDLGKSLVAQGHQITYLVPQGSTCPFGNVITWEPNEDWRDKIPHGIDVVHLQFNPGANIDCDHPWLITQHGNSDVGEKLPLNTVFVSANHAQRHGADCHVHNGLDWSSYGPVDLKNNPSDYFHFLGKAAWRVKNVRGAIDVCRAAHKKLVVMGGTRLNLKRGFRFTWSPSISFLGMVGGEQKFEVMRHSRGLVFPVRWHEPFGLAVIESLYFGCPVFSTPYGALPELVTEECGHLSAHLSDLSMALSKNTFNRQECHQRATQQFNADVMAKKYLAIYERVISGEFLNHSPPVMRETAVQLPWHLD
jgi:glycosyltransferase involved in cell wall biosynthesis